MARATVNPGDVGVELPDQSALGEGAGNRDAIANAMLAQQQYMGGMGGGGGGGLPPWMTAMQGQPQPMDYSQYFGRPAQPSGSITDVGWMNALQPWQGGVSVGGQPGNPDLSARGYMGGGSMAYADPNYWGGMGGGGGGGGPARYLPGGGLDPNDPNNIALYYRLMGMGGIGGDAGYGGMSGGGGGGYGGGSGYSGGGPFGANGPAVGATGISPSEANQAAARGDPSSPQGPAGWGAQQGFNDYGGITGPTSAGMNVGSIAGGPATMGAPGSGTAFGSSGWGGFGLGAGDMTGPLGGYGQWGGGYSSAAADNSSPW